MRAERPSEDPLMRKFLMVTMVAGLGLGLSQSATANYFWPGRVIIVAPGGGGTTSGSTTNAAAMGCPEQIECECFEAGTSLVDACKLSGVLECVDPLAAYDYVKQLQPVLIETPNRTLGGLQCAGKSNSTAFVYLSENQPAPPPQP